MFRPTDDLRIRDVRPLIPPAILLEEIPISERASIVVSDARAAIADVIGGTDPRLVVVVGPCSIHDTKAAFEYAERLKRTADRLSDSLIIVMRTYFEKPRTAVGWKGLINDPDLDESYHINKGLRLARKLLLDLNDLGLPTASEFLDTQIPQHIADLTSWVAIGARTAESQIHRELASGLSMPVGFKNSTDGSTQIAVDAVLTARSPHWFPSVTKQGVAAIFQTVGNDSCHVILRGGTRTGPNYGAEHIAKVSGRLAAKGLRESVMVDCSHGNSHKNHLKQADVASAVCEQIASGSRQIFGAMIESHLVEGRQDYVPGEIPVYGQSITDACLSFAQTEPLLEQLAEAQQARG
ncbi:MAG: 3-deoxy-7-phosphoheptulonate synthase [Acidobacteria bacterium]|nr:MAG: 3-deoxy-7-phosphoheptulonate synthase [Acidobacteriota bacterium]PYR48825.1 MAG: 3-deoxy-7-phosphoheptulonate synthase [Acidobacteriota bacterium]